MNRTISIAFCLLAATTLAGCGAMQRNIERTNNSLYEGSKKTRSKIAGYIFDKSEEPAVPAPHAPRYCYDVRSDVVCYDQPRPMLRTQRVGTGEVDEVPMASPDEYEISQLMGNGPMNGSVNADPNRNLGQFFNPARPNNSGSINGQFGGATSNQTPSAFVPEAPSIRGIDDPVGGVASQSHTTGFASSASRPRQGQTSVSTAASRGGPPTMNTAGPEPTTPPPGFEAPQPLINAF
jgi:hypothetical protein